MRNTKQREMVYKVVSESCDHPTAETIYERTRLLLPSISLGTVYRNLKQLSEMGAIREIIIANGSDRYDKTVRLHAHFSCRECGEVFDIPCDFTDNGIGTTICGNEVENVEVLYRGICNKCKAK